MKRKILIILSIFMVILIAGCADSGSNDSGTGSTGGSDTGIGGGIGDGGDTGDGSNTDDGTGEPDDGQEPTKNISIKQYKYINDGSIGFDDTVYIKLVVIGMDNKLYSTEDSDAPLTLVNGINKNVKKLFSAGYTAYILTEDNELYGWGKNSYGQLGLGHNENIAEPVKIEGINQAVKEIYSINEHKTIYALTESGEVYSWGYNQHYLLGTGSNVTDVIFTPQKLNIPAKVKSLSIINNFFKFAVFAITETGEIYTWGKNENGNLGLGQNITDTLISQPTLIPSLKNVNKFFDINYNIAPYYYVITKENTLYYWGNNEYNNTIVDSPKQFQWQHSIIKKLSYAKAGEDYIYIALTEDSEVYLWGKDLSNSFMKLSREISETPVKISYVNEKIEDIVVNIELYPNGLGRTTYVVLLTTTGKVYQWENKDILSMEDKGDNNILIPDTLKSIPETVTKILPDGNNNIYALTESGNIYGWGNNKYGTLGIGSSTFFYSAVYTPEKLNASNIIEMNSNLEAMFVFDSNQQLYYWGFGIGYYDVTGTPTLINKN